MGLIGKGALRQEVVDGNILVDTEENGGLLLTAENTRALDNGFSTLHMYNIVHI